MQLLHVMDIITCSRDHGLVTDQALVRKLEKLQHYATKLIHSLSDKSYHDCLIPLDVPCILVL